MPNCIVPTKREIWKPVPGFKGYRVSNRGQISGKLGAPLCPTANRSDYLYIKADNETGRHTLYIHKAVAEAFLGPRPDGAEVNHVDGNHANNRADNLEWVTRRQNIIHAKRVLRRGLGGDKRRKLNRKKVSAIKELLRRGHTATRLAVWFGVSLPTVIRIRSGRCWSHVA